MSGDPPNDVAAQVECVSFSPIPLGHIDRTTWQVTVERAVGFQGTRWAVRTIGRVLNVLTLRWELEPIPSDRSDQWLANHRFDDYDQACAVAAAMAPSVTYNGLAAADIARGPSSVASTEVKP